MKAITAENGIAGEPLSEESGFPRTPSPKTSSSAQTAAVIRPTTPACASTLREKAEANSLRGTPSGDGR